MGGLQQYRREELITLRAQCNIRSLGKQYQTKLRRHGICVFPTHRGTRGSKHLNPTPTIVTSRSNNSLCLSTVNCNNMKQIECHGNMDKPLLAKSMKMGYLNARSVRNKGNEIVNFITENQLDVCAITETWLSGNDSKDQIVCGDLTPVGFKLEHVARDKRRGGGVAILLKASLTCKKQKLTKYNTFEIIEVLLKSKKDSVTLGVLYRPPSGNSVTAFIEELTSYLDTHSLTNRKFLLIGDFNFHMDNIRNKDSAKLLDVLHSMNLQQHVQQPTHIKGHLLDLIITRSNEDIVDTIHYHPMLISDHAPLTFHILAAKPPAVRKAISFRKIRDINLKEFEKDILESDLVTCPSDDINELVKQYNRTLTSLMEKHAPIIRKDILVRQNTKWFTEEIKMAKQKRRQQERKWLADKSTVNLEILREKRNSVNRLVAASKKAYYQSEIENNKKDQKALFNITGQLLHKKKDCVLPSHTDPKQMANSFATFFTDKIETIRQGFDITSDVPSHPDALSIVPTLSSFLPISSKDLKKLISGGNSKSSILDPFPTSILKDLLDCLVPTITNIVNKSIQACSFPDDFKQAAVTPLLKKPSLDKEQLGNYQPVSPILANQMKRS